MHDQSLSAVSMRNTPRLPDNGASSAFKRALQAREHAFLYSSLPGAPRIAQAYRPVER